VSVGTDHGLADVSWVDATLSDAGFETTLSDDGVRWSCPGEQGVAAMARVGSRGQVWLTTNGLYRLADAQDSRRVVLVLTQIATLSHDLDWGALSLNPASGEVIYRITLPAGPASATVLREATGAMCRDVAIVEPVLVAAGTTKESE
jgi:hypothetical protein